MKAIEKQNDTDCQGRVKYNVNVRLNVYIKEVFLYKPYNIHNFTSVVAPLITLF